MSESTRKLIRDYTLAITLAVVIALLIRFFLIEAYRIPSQAMRPTLHAGDTIFVAKWPFGIRLPGSHKPLTTPRAPRRGEVVVFSSPTEPDREFVKRVVALSGETVKLRSGRLWVNEQPIDVEEPKGKSGDPALCGLERFRSESGMLTHGVCWEPPLLSDFGPKVVPENSVFVLGDLRSEGEGSQRQIKGESWGIIPLESLKGSALWVWLSVEPGGMEGDWFPRFRFERMFRRIK